MYRVVAGIDTYPQGPGYKHIKIMPHIGGNLTYANADLKTYYGTVSSHWKIDNGKLQLDVEIPANTTATVYVPAKSAEEITEGGNALSSLRDIKIAGTENGYIELDIGSGKYHFAMK
jgi:alpha-L-rhamnosidase